MCVETVIFCHSNKLKTQKQAFQTKRSNTFCSVKYRFVELRLRNVRLLSLESDLRCQEPSQSIEPAEKIALT